MARRFQPAQGAIDDTPVQAGMRDRHLPSLLSQLVAMGLAESSDGEQHNRLREAVKIAHLAGAGLPAILALSVSMTTTCPHGRLLALA